MGSIRHSINSIIAAIDSEIEMLENARNQLLSIEGTVEDAAPPATKPAKRKLSAAARERIAGAQAWTRAPYRS